MGDYICMKDFLEYVESGMLIDYDGFGRLCKDEVELEEHEYYIKPSYVGERFSVDYLLSFSGVMWHNR